MGLVRTKTTKANQGTRTATQGEKARTRARAHAAGSKSAVDLLATLAPQRMSGPSWVATALFAGALLFGSLASLADPYRLGTRLALLALIGLGLLYLGVVAFAVRAALREKAPGPTLESFLALTPTQFEEVVGQLLARSGYSQVRHVGGAGDLGADLVCRDARGRRVVVQCKRYAPEQRVGSQVVQTFLGMVAIHHRAQGGILVTTSGFTTPAQDLAREHDLLLIDGPALVKLAEDVLSQDEPIEAYDPHFAAEPDLA